MELFLDFKKRYTYADYLTWVDGKARELIHGFIKMMSPAPRLEHAKVSKNICWHLETIVRQNKGKCQVFFAPFDVRFPKQGENADEQIDTVVQPDICVICDASKIDVYGCCGAPDLIVEILSPSSFKKDVFEKFALYEEFGVKEYWIVHPKDKTITVFILQENGKYNVGITYVSKDMEKSQTAVKAPVFIFDNYLIDLEDIFDF